MNWGQFKDPLSGSVKTSWSLTPEITDSNDIFHKQFVTEFNKFSENIWGKVKCGKNLYSNSTLAKTVVSEKLLCVVIPNIVQKAILVVLWSNVD